VILTLNDLNRLNHKFDKAFVRRVWVAIEKCPRILGRWLEIPREGHIDPPVRSIFDFMSLLEKITLYKMPPAHFGYPKSRERPERCQWYALLEKFLLDLNKKYCSNRNARDPYNLSRDVEKPFYTQGCPSMIWKRPIGIVLAVAVCLINPPNSYGAEQDPDRVEENARGYSLVYTPVYQFKTDLDGGGTFDVRRHYFRFGAFQRLDPQWSVGLNVSYDYENWNFSDVDDIVGTDLWNTIHRPGIGVAVNRSFSDQWRLSIVPSVEFSGASGTDLNEALTYGAVVSLSHAFSRDLVLGIGVGVFDRLEETDAFPFLVIDWKISPHVRLTNPLRAGPAGPAGLELVYSPDGIWSFGVGGAYRSYRFRLDDRSAVTDGIGEVEFLVTFAKAARRFGSRLSLDISAGALFDGEIAIEDAGGNELGSTGYDTAPFAAVTLTGRF
jgi:hypothetical protein